MRGRTLGVAGYLCAAALALAAGRADAQAISGLGITNSSSSDVVVTSDPGHERKSALAIQSSAGPPPTSPA
jgi:hypothetical protein